MNLEDVRFIIDQSGVLPKYAYTIEEVSKNDIEFVDGFYEGTYFWERLPYIGQDFIKQYGGSFPSGPFHVKLYIYEGLYFTANVYYNQEHVFDFLKRQIGFSSHAEILLILGSSNLRRVGLRESYDYKALRDEFEAVVGKAIESDGWLCKIAKALPTFVWDCDKRFAKYAVKTIDTLIHKIEIESVDNFPHDALVESESQLLALGVLRSKLISFIKG